jgi:peptide/nickel transport system ATP-binding protein
MHQPLLSVKNLHTYFDTYAGQIKAVEDVSFSLNPGEMLGVVGESGCGKTVMARSLMRLIPNPPGRIVSGEILFKGKSVLSLSEREMQEIRGNQISMIFQEPMSSLNPVFTIGNQLSEVFVLHQKLNKKQAFQHSLEMLRTVEIPSPEVRIHEYPFQLSGGMRQRVMIAMALACRPHLILADEPTTALDVTIQAQILDLIRQCQKDFGTALILITHDLGVIAEMVQRVLIMYTGKVLEQGSVEDLFNTPLHPYTEGLILSLPSLDSKLDKEGGPLREISGVVPDLSRLPQGCTFFPRCPRVMKVCHQETPPFVEIQPGHAVRCWLFN